MGEPLDLRQILDLVRGDRIIEALKGVDSISKELLGLLEDGDYWAEEIFAELTAKEGEIPKALKPRERVARIAEYKGPGVEEPFPTAVSGNPYNTMGTLYHVKANQDRTRSFYAKARAYYEKARALDPKAESVIANMALLELDQGNVEGALALATAALKMKKDSAVAHTVLGLVYMRKNLADRAETEFLEANRKEPGNPEASYNLAIAQIELKKYPDARKTLTNLIGVENT